MFTFNKVLCIIIVEFLSGFNYTDGGVKVSIAGERKDKHTADGVTA